MLKVWWICRSAGGETSSYIALLWIAPVLKFVQIDGMFFLHLGLDPLLQVADRLVVEKIHSKRELLLTSPDWRLRVSRVDTVIVEPTLKQHRYPLLPASASATHSFALPLDLRPPSLLHLTFTLKGAHYYDFFPKRTCAF